MKTLFKIFLFTALISLFTGCNKTDEFFENENPELKNAQVEVTVPFKAEFYGLQNHSDYSDRRCATEENPNIFFPDHERRRNSNPIGETVNLYDFLLYSGTSSTILLWW
jgi:hypothetical protein